MESRASRIPRRIRSSLANPRDSPTTTTQLSIGSRTLLLLRGRSVSNNESNRLSMPDSNWDSFSETEYITPDRNLRQVANELHRKLSDAEQSLDQITNEAHHQLKSSGQEIQALQQDNLQLRHMITFLKSEHQSSLSRLEELQAINTNSKYQCSELKKQLIKTKQQLKLTNSINQELETNNTKLNLQLTPFTQLQSEYHDLFHQHAELKLQQAQMELTLQDKLLKFEYLELENQQLKDTILNLTVNYSPPQLTYEATSPQTNYLTSYSSLNSSSFGLDATTMDNKACHQLWKTWDKVKSSLLKSTLDSQGYQNNANKLQALIYQMEQHRKIPTTKLSLQHMFNNEELYQPESALPSPISETKSKFPPSSPPSPYHQNEKDHTNWYVLQWWILLLS